MDGALITEERASIIGLEIHELKQKLLNGKLRPIKVLEAFQVEETNERLGEYTVKNETETKIFSYP